MTAVSDTQADLPAAVLRAVVRAGMAFSAATIRTDAGACEHTHGHTHVTPCRKADAATLREGLGVLNEVALKLASRAEPMQSVASRATR